MTDKKQPIRHYCSGHPQTEATHQCESCRKYLCSQCLSQTRHLFFCQYCGAHAYRLISTQDEETRTRKTETSTTHPGLFKEIAFNLTNHVLLPIAVIVMVSAFLFFLLDVRSVFLQGSTGLKRIGFFFVAATVLIARYGKVHAIKARQNLYTIILAIATFLAMSKHSGGGINFPVNMLIIAAVWRFATAVTNNLELEEENEIKDPHEQKLYGLERIKFEEVQEQYHIRPDRYARKKPKEKEKNQKKKKNWLISGGDALGNPAKPVARLAAMAIVIFALGEPFILSGPPQVGQRALVAVIVFLLCTGIVLAAGSAVGTYHHTLQHGGKASLGMVPLKMAIGFLLMLTILATGLMTPGLKYQGSGVMQPQAIYGKGGTPGKDDKQGGTSQKNQTNPSNQKNQPSPRDRQEMNEATGKNIQQENQPPSSNQGQAQSPTESIFNLFATIGKLLLIPVGIGVAILLIYTLVKLWPALKGWRSSMKDHWQRFLEKLRGLFQFRREKSSSQSPGKNPLDSLATIHTLPPKEAILTAYTCFIAFVEQLGYERLPRLTPYEYLHSLPGRLSYLTPPAQQLTHLYITAAYSPLSPTIQDSRQALEELSRLQALIRNREER